MPPTGDLASKPSPHGFTPQILPLSTLLANPPLSNALRAFANRGYRYIAPQNLPRWNLSLITDRLPDTASLVTALTPRGFFAVIFAPSSPDTPIACAAAAPWTGGFDGCAAPEELQRGWEIKIVTTGEGWQGRGLAGRCVDALVGEMVRVERESGAGWSEEVKVWVQAVEDLNGAYWRKMGWVDVRGEDHPPGRFGSKVGYRLLVLLKTFEL